MATEFEAREILHRHGRADALVTVVQSAWDEHVSESRLRSNRARASVVWDYMGQAAEKHFAGIEGVRLVEIQGGVPLYVCDNKIAIRFKKLDRGHRPRNIKTAQQRRINRQLSLDGMEPLTYVSVGYVLDRAQADIEQIVAAKHVGKNKEWSIDLRDVALGNLEPVTSILPFMPTGGTAQKNPIRIVSAAKKGEATE